MIKNNFRKDINGLRAVAVLSVVIFHFMPQLLKGGFAGVDIFFVISGFLMTSIIYRGHEKNQFTYKRFYLARAKRIIPALTVISFFVLVFGWLYISPSSYEVIAKHVLTSITFLSNFMFWSEAGYFDIASRSKFLLHTWSLSVEWQFYIAYPVLIGLLFRLFGPRNSRYMILALMIFSFIFSCYSSIKWPDSAYFLLPSRSWEMLCGGLVFLFPLKLGEIHKKIISTSGLVVIFLSCWYFSDTDIWPGYNALIPVLGASFLISANVCNKFLDSKPLQLIGLWSYSIYLWHWVILSIIYFFEPFSSNYTQCFGIFLSLIVGGISFKLIESKINTKPILFIYFSTLLISIFVIAFPDLSSKAKKFTALYDTQDWVGQYKDYKDSSMGGDYWVPCASGWQMAEKGKVDVADKCIKNKGKGGVFVLGDSHAAALALGIRSLLKDSVPYNQLASPGCVINWDDNPEKLSNNNFFKGCVYQNILSEKLIKEIKPSVVILGRARSHEKIFYDKLAIKINSLGVKNVIIMGPLPQWEPSLPIALTKNKTVMGDYVISPALRNDVINTNKIIKNEYEKYPFIKFVDLIGSLCHTIGEDFACRYKINDKNLITFDYGHPTDAGSLFIAEKVIKPYIPYEMLK